MRIAHVPMNVANYAWKLAEAQRALGHEAVVFSRPTPYNFPADVMLSPHTDPLRWNLEMLRHLKTLNSFDVVHIHGGIWRTQVFYRLLKKPVLVIHYHGHGVRSSKGLHHQGLGDVLLYTPPDLKVLLPRKAIEVPPLAPMGQPLESLPSIGGRVVFVHFSTSERNKGTSKVVRMFREAFPGVEYHTVDGHEFYVSKEAELRVFRKLTPARVLFEMRFADVVFDQIAPLGIYGTIGVEGMWMGKPVLATLNPDLYSGDCPVIEPTPSMLAQLVKNKATRRWYGAWSREYVTREHDPLRIAQKVLDAYEGA